VKAAQEFTDRKIKLITENAEQLQQVIGNKRKNLEAVVGYMQRVIASEEQQQQLTQT